MAKLKGTTPPNLYCLSTHCRTVTKHAPAGTTTRHGCECNGWKCAYCKRVTWRLEPVKAL